MVGGVDVTPNLLCKVRGERERERETERERERERESGERGRMVCCFFSPAAPLPSSFPSASSGSSSPCASPSSAPCSSHRSHCARYPPPSSVPLLLLLAPHLHLHLSPPLLLLSIPLVLLLWSPAREQAPFVIDVSPPGWTQHMALIGLLASASTLCRAPGREPWLMQASRFPLRLARPGDFHREA